MGYIKNNHTVELEVQYPGKLVDGSAYEKSTHQDRLEISIGNKKTSVEVEKGISALSIGDRKTISVPPKDAFGPKRPELIINVKKDILSKKIEPIVGQTLRIRQKGGVTIDTNVVDVKKDTITLDANHFHAIT